eukprot:7174856-Prymnesium_polylepis.1
MQLFSQALHTDERTGSSAVPTAHSLAQMSHTSLVATAVVASPGCAKAFELTRRRILVPLGGWWDERANTRCRSGGDPHTQQAVPCV